MDTLNDVQKYLEYQLKSNPKYVSGRKGKEELNLFWAGINNSKTIIEIALANPEKFHDLVKGV